MLTSTSECQLVPLKPCLLWVHFWSYKLFLTSLIGRFISSSWLRCLICIWTILWGCLEVTGWLKIKEFNSSKKLMQIPLKVNKVYFCDIKHGHGTQWSFDIFFQKVKITPYLSLQEKNCPQRCLLILIIFEKITILSFLVSFKFPKSTPVNS